MIKALGGNTVILGLELENLRRLLAGEPVFIRKASLGIERDILIFAGRDRKHLVSQLREGGIKLPEAFHIGKALEET